MSSTTDHYRSRHGEHAYARLAARASMAGLQSLVAEPAMPTVVEPSRRVAGPTGPLHPSGAPRPARSTTPGAIPGRNTAGRALPVRDGAHPPTTR